METISQTLHSASNAIWSEVKSLQEYATGQPGHDEPKQDGEDRSHEEPLAGIQGKGTVTDPYDAGNREDQPGHPETQENTALVTEPLVSILPAIPESQSPSSPPPSSSSSPSHPSDPAASAMETTTVPEIDPHAFRARPEAPSSTAGLDSKFGDLSITNDMGPDNVAVAELSPKQELEKGDMDEKDVSPATSSPITTAPTTSSSNTSSSSTTTAAAADSTTRTPEVPPTPAPSRSENIEQQQTPSDTVPKRKDSGIGPDTKTSMHSDIKSESEYKSEEEMEQKDEKPEHKKPKVSEEALKGPKCPAPREPYEFEKELDGDAGKKNKKLDNDPQQNMQILEEKIHGGIAHPEAQAEHGSGSHNSSNSSTQDPDGHHHHKSIKERLGKVMKLGDHLHHSNRQ